MISILDRIVEYKREEVRKARANAPLSALTTLAREQAPARGFAPALERKSADGFALIAEIKKASPSKGLIRADFDPAAHARAYQAGGAAALSVLTDGPSFQGSPSDLAAARDASSLPAIRKDFMIDPYQVVEARAMGADAILLIMACLEDAQAAEIESAAISLGMDVLAETHDEEEFERALRLRTRLIGVNNRDLRSFRTDLSVTERLAKRLPFDRLLIAESGINSHADLVRLAAAGAKAFLVGESLMRTADLEAATRALLEGARTA